MIDISKENLITLDEAAGLLPVGRRRRPVNGATILRWITDGSRGIRLEAVRIGGRWLTTQAALQRFAERLTEATLPEEPATPSTQCEQSEAGAQCLEDRPS